MRSILFVRKGIGVPNETIISFDECPEMKEKNKIIKELHFE
jgi:hypothetical protein